MGSKPLPEHERFAANTTILAHAVYDGVKRLYDAGYQTIDPNVIAFAITVISAFDKHYLIQGFIENSHEYCWDNIKKRDESFFVSNAGNIFKYLPMDKVNLFKDLFTTRGPNGESIISQVLKDQIWKLFDTMITISIKYVHKGRAPYSYDTSDGPTNAYGVSFFDDVDIRHHSAVWNVSLDFPPNY